MEKCSNQECGKQFKVYKSGGGVTGGKEKEPVICPHCQTIVRTEMTSATFHTSKLSEDDS
ncbi:hypothetical protein BMETH_1869_0 [methanotrophic bacterial endosymbiont of Bathymodiolus sp.]|nr:hypothetical protein BMETH_1869_0 [methanotrophic bacterial endosymbiont of Bathymodiolus sp.]